MVILKQFGILFVLGSVGIVMYTITSIPLVEQQLAKLSPEILANVLPLWVLILLQGLQPTVLLAISILIGIGCAYRVGLRSHLIVIIRALLVNGIVGIAFGWLFWQYSLEAAMLAHISFHAFTSVLSGLLARLA